MPTQFVCRDCHADVFDLAGWPVPDPPLCSVCAWIVRTIPPDEQAEVRRMAHRGSPWLESG